jgi:hypothetical protein
MVILYERLCQLFPSNITLFPWPGLGFQSLNLPNALGEGVYRQG